MISPGTTITVVDHDSPPDRDAIFHALMAHNRAHAPDPNFQLLGLLLKSDSGETIGGLWGRSAYEWLFVEMLFVPEHLRHASLGRTLMQQAEGIALERQCTGVWLDTFAFQALGFYQRLGYTIFGELRDHPRGISQYWLQKRF